MSNITQTINNSATVQFLRGLWEMFVNYGPILVLISVAYGLGRVSINNLFGATYVLTSWAIIVSSIRQEIQHERIKLLIESNAKEVKQIFDSCREKLKGN